MFSEINSAMLWEFGSWVNDGNGCSCFSFATLDNALFDPAPGEIPRLVHSPDTQDMGWELLQSHWEKSMKLGYSDVYSFRGAHRE